MARPGHSSVPCGTTGLKEVIDLLWPAVGQTFLSAGSPDFPVRYFSNSYSCSPAVALALRANIGPQGRRYNIGSERERVGVGKPGDWKGFPSPPRFGFPRR